MPCDSSQKLLSYTGTIRFVFLKVTLLASMKKNHKRRTFLDVKALLFQDEDTFLEEMLSKGWRQYVPCFEGSVVKHMFLH